MDPRELQADPREAALLAGQLIGNVAACPCCSKTAVLVGDVFVCSDRGCRFRAGDTFDYLAWKNGGDYALAIEDLKMNRRMSLALTAFRFDEDPLPILESLRRRRDIFEWVLTTSKHDDLGTGEMVQAESWISAHGVHPSRSVFVADRKALKRLGEILAKYGDADVVPKEMQVVFPHFAHFNEVTELFFFDRDRRGDEAWQRLTIVPGKVSWYGLLELPLNASNVKICDSCFDAAALNSTTFNLSLDTTHLACFNPKTSTELHHWSPESATYLRQEDEPLEGAGMIATLARIIPNFSIAGHPTYEAHPAPAMPWETFVCQEVVRLCKNGKLGLAGPYLQKITPDVALSSRIINALTLRSMGAEAREANYILSRNLVYKNDKQTLFETSGGYEGGRLNQEGRQPISNFTVELEYNLTFTDSVDIWHFGTMFFEGHRFPFRIAGKNIDSVPELEGAARLSVLQEGTASLAGRPLASIMSRPLGKLMASYLRSCASKVPCRDGISRLGWSFDNRLYQTPFGIIREDGLEEKEYAPNPDRAWNKYFLKHPATVVSGDVRHVTLRDVISRSVAMIARAYYRLPIKPIFILNTVRNQNIIRQLFYGLGQAVPFEFSMGVRQGGPLDDLEGFPSYGVGILAVATEQRQAVFVFGESGLDMGDIPIHEVTAASAFLREAMIQTVAWLIRTQGAEFQRSASALYDSALLREGATCIQVACQRAEWGAESYIGRQIEEVLRHIPLESIAEYFSHELRTQRILFYTKGIPPSVDRADLEIELLGLTKQLATHDTWLSVDALSMLHILQNYYGQPVAPRIIPVTQAAQAQAAQ